MTHAILSLPATVDLPWRWPMVDWQVGVPWAWVSAAASSSTPSTARIAVAPSCISAVRNVLQPCECLTASASDSDSSGKVGMQSPPWLSLFPRKRPPCTRPEMQRQSSQLHRFAAIL
ncbi:uncharacterized protein HMPREF1120_02162 [Exophiala dermatitidis NIH/UT8656]|uniref:Uncharacterized protein n=1 Tax=Exophiala dermatitidis (strain ATCC 34100 / CBS 525.76 / NIH/UT8656) TaxID=858893 RepID=H6BRI0_EXODN|nr:uncharacterized protein HMPREF1120_02162 [Exophiala dermatitidis NIH/UT8656]EHY53985.1 hypothetical protein HMPREF1120_02162 [Exophiala dermatitidis NIH/UT8656]